MTLLFIQLVRMVLWVVVPTQFVTPADYALNYCNVINQIFNVIIISDHFYFFCFTKIFTWLGHHTNNFGAGFNEIVLQ